MSDSEITKPKAVCKNCGYEWTPRNPGGKHRFKCSKCGAENVELVNADAAQPETPPAAEPQTAEPKKPEKTHEITKPSPEEIAAMINEPPRDKPRLAKQGGDNAANPEEEQTPAGTLIPNVHPIMAVYLLIALCGIGAILYFRAKRRKPVKRNRKNMENQPREQEAQQMRRPEPARKGIVGL